MKQVLNNEIITLFISESEKLLCVFDKIIMESDADDTLYDPAELFRVLHTLKGSSSMMNYSPLVDASHRLENTLSVIRSTGMSPSGKPLQAVIDAGIAFSSYFRSQLAHVAGAGTPEHSSVLVSQLDALASDFGALAASPVGVKAFTAPTGHEPAGENEICLKIMLRKCPLSHIRAYLVAKSVKEFCTDFTTEPAHLDVITGHDDYILKNGFEVRLIPKPGTDINAVKEKIIAQPFVETCIAALVSNHREENDASELVSSVMVPQELVNRLIHYADELATEESTLEGHMEKNGLNRGTTRSILSELRYTVHEIDTLASQIGTQSIDGIFMQMQMTVRNMARELNKEIRVQLSGNEVKADKSTLEILSDCLIHIVRNSVDHGIEPPDERIKSGKPETGVIALSAQKKNDYIFVTVTDDGCGVDSARVLDIAERKGLLKKPRAEYTYAQVSQLLFISGISTNKSVTQYSGRGVGLDTVVRRVRQAGGLVTVDSTKGCGTVFTIKLPVSLLTVEGIEVKFSCGDMLVPVNAVGHIAVANGNEGQTIEYNSDSYSPLSIPGGRAEGRGGFILFLSHDFGTHYIYANRISMVSSYYVKPLPECVSDLLGQDNIYSGCVLCPDSRLLCILDLQKLTALGTG